MRDIAAISRRSCEDTPRSMLKAFKTGPVSETAVAVSTAALLSSSGIGSYPSLKAAASTIAATAAGAVTLTSCASPDNSSVENCSISAKEQPLPQFEQHHILTSLDPLSMRAENRQLKELVVSQLDLIQQQSETILCRDRQLCSLRRENEQLRRRLERLELRVGAGGDDAVISGATASKSGQQKPLNSSNSISGCVHKQKDKQPVSNTTNRKRPFSSVDSGQQKSKRVKHTATSGDRGDSDVQNENTPLKAETTSVNNDFPFGVLTDEIFEECDDPFLNGDKAAKAVVTTTNTQQDWLERTKKSQPPPKSRKLSVAAGTNSEDIKPNESSRSKTPLSVKQHPGEKTTTTNKERGLKKRNNTKPSNTTSTPTVLATPPNGSPAVSVSGASGGGSGGGGSSGAATGVLEPIMTTYHYYIGCQNDIINKDDKLDEVAMLQQRGVEVPKFREDAEYDRIMNRIRANRKNPYTMNHCSTGNSSSTSSSGSVGKSMTNSDTAVTENLTDTAYLKRHEKPEATEKRLKKWDIQRLREKSYYERLKARYNLANNHASYHHSRGARRSLQQQQIGQKQQQQLHQLPPLSDSLLPTPEGALRIAVSRDGRIPVSALGEPLPNLPQSFFTLPWRKDDINVVDVKLVKEEPQTQRAASVNKKSR